MLGKDKKVTLGVELNTGYRLKQCSFNPTWKCEMFGMNEGMTLSVEEKQVPNWFWRWTQYILLGNRWYKIKENEDD